MRRGYLLDIHQILRKHVNIFKTSAELARIFYIAPIIAHRRPGNLNDILVHGKKSKTTEVQARNGPCNTSGCKTRRYYARIQLLSGPKQDVQNITRWHLQHY